MGLTDLFRPRWRHSKPDVRKVAVARLIDQALLAEIARNDLDTEVRMAAIARLTDQTMLSDIARGDLAPNIREAAVDKLNDQRVLTDLVRNDPVKKIRTSAISRLSGESALEVAATPDGDPVVRQRMVAVLIRNFERAKTPAASKPFKDLLERFAMHDADAEVKRLARQAICPHAWGNPNQYTREQYRDNGPGAGSRRGDYTETYESRTCSNCGLSEEKLVDVYEHGD